MTAQPDRDYLPGMFTRLLDSLGLEAVCEALAEACRVQQRISETEPDGGVREIAWYDAAQHLSQTCQSALIRSALSLSHIDVEA